MRVTQYTSLRYFQKQFFIISNVINKTPNSPRRRQTTLQFKQVMFESISLINPRLSNVSFSGDDILGPNHGHVRHESVTRVWVLGVGDLNGMNHLL